MSQLLILGMLVLAVGPLVQQLWRCEWQKLAPHVPRQLAQRIPVRSGTIAASTTGFNLFKISLVSRLERSRSVAKLGALRIICGVLLALAATAVANAVGTDDDFDRSDSGTLGPNWTNTVNAVGIASNRAQIQTPDVMNLARYTGTSFSSDHYSEATYKANSGLYLILAVRAQANGDAYLCMPYLFGNEVRIYSYVGGTETLLTSLSGAAPAGDHVYRCEATGSSPTSIKVYDNGVQIGSTYTDSTAGLQSDGAPGLGGKKSEDQWDNWSGGDIGAGGGGTCTAANIAAGGSGCPQLTQAMVLGQNDGGFCPPTTMSNGSYLDFSPGWTIGYSPERNTLYWNGSAGSGSSPKFIAELTIPPPVYATTTEPMNVAVFTATGGLVDPTEGKYPQTWPDSPNTDGTLTVPTMLLPWSDGRLYGAFAYYYENGEPTTHPFYSRPLNLDDTNHVNGMYMPWTGTGSATGYHITKKMTVCGGRIPSEWQPSFGNKPAFLCSGATYSVIANQSYGPTFWPIDPPNDFTGNNVATAKPALFYPHDHQTLGGWDGYEAGEFMDISTQVTGCVAINGTRTYLCFGTTGSTGCYGYGLSDPNDPRIGTDAGNGNTWCYDPASPNHGQHGWPYKYRVWAYDLNVMKNVYAGLAYSWDPRPYGFWELSFPVDHGPAVMPRIRGVGYDPANRYLYVVQDQGCVGNNGIVWRFTVDITP